MLTKFATLLLAVAWSPPVLAQPSEREQPVRYQCGDLVVIGRVHNNRDYQHVDMGDDILGHGWMTARIAVGRLLFGHQRARSVDVRYFGHTYYREDRDFVLVIGPPDNGLRTVKRAYLVERGRAPPLQPACS